MIDLRKPHDVLISYAAGDATLATEIANACRADGLDAVTDAELLSGDNAGDALWEALAESRALLVILSPTGPTPSMSIELGAAQSWDKPIFGVVADPAYSRACPLGLLGYVFTPGRIEDVIREIKSVGQELTEKERSQLAKTYAEIGVPVDRLVLDPERLTDLMNRFNASAAKTVPGERLLSELLRMRKQGKLVKSRAAERSKPRKSTA